MQSLEEFVSAHREQILARCTDAVRQISPSLAEADALAELGASLDELVGALRRDRESAGLEPPQKSSSGLLQGRQRQRLGIDIDIVTRDYGSLSDAIMTTAMEENAAFSAREYQVMNLTLDEAVAAAVQEFWSRSRAELEHRTTEQVGMLVHELRNSLSSATLAFSAISRGRVTVQSKTADVLERGLARASALVDQTFAAVKLGALVGLERHRLRMGDLLREAASAQTPERGVRVRIEADDDTAVDGDPTLLASAVGNLLQNALKFTHDGTTVVLRARTIAQRVLVEVEDECGGLPPGRPEDLFAPYVQRGPNRDGLGLGLRIVRDAVRAHGGEVRVRDLPGKGCVFTLELPSAA